LLRQHRDFSGTQETSSSRRPITVTGGELRRAARVSQQSGRFIHMILTVRPLPFLTDRDRPNRRHSGLRSRAL